MTDAPALPRRFYASASVTEEGGFGVLLDARRLRTPAGAPLQLPSRALAEAMAREWNAQEEFIAPTTMPVTQLAFAAIDWTARGRAERIEHVAAYGATDLCCHRAETPSELVQRQHAAWDPIVSWGEAALGVRLPVVNGVIAAPVEAQSIETLRAHAAALDDFALTALSQATALTGSVLIAFAILHGRLDSERAFAAAALDNLWSIERWGEDEEACARLDQLRREIEAVGVFVAALHGDQP